MMIVSFQGLQQDTVKRSTSTGQVAAHGKSDSTSVLIPVQQKDTSRFRTVFINQNTLPDAGDTTSVCSRNAVADITFFDFNSFVRRLGYGNTDQFPFAFIDRAREAEEEHREFLLKQLKPGNELPRTPLHADWMIIILIAAAFLFSMVKSSSKRMLTYFERIFVFRRNRDSGVRDTSGLFHWQSTVLNLISFLVIGMYLYSAINYFELAPAGIKGIIVWLACCAFISLAVTVRHIVCVITGAISGQKELFGEYLLGIYHSYRFGAVFLFVFLILMSFTEILPARDYILSGLFILSIIYIVRVIRLLIIFINRNISIFYLILYLCALEILPVLIIVRYFTGRV